MIFQVLGSVYLITINGTHLIRDNVENINNNNSNGILNYGIVIIGISARSIQLAHFSWKEYKPDYFFVGTCYVTQSHPEKTPADLEGPALPCMSNVAIHNDIFTSSRSRLDCGFDHEFSLKHNSALYHCSVIFAISRIDSQRHVVILLSYLVQIVWQLLVL